MENRSWHRHYDYSVPTSVRAPRILVPDILNIPANAYPDKIGVEFYGRGITFWELRKEVFRMANALGKLGIQQGDRIGIQLPPSPQYMIAYYAVLLAGGIVVNLNPMYTVEELKLIAENTGLKAIFTSDMTLSTIRTLCRTADIPQVIVTRLDDYAEGEGSSSERSLDLEKGWSYFSSVTDGCSDSKRPQPLLHRRTRHSSSLPAAPRESRRERS